MTIPSSRRVSSALTRTRPRCAWAAWCLLSCLLALAAEHASAAAAPREVRSAQELQDAVNAGETDIRLLQHVVLSELNPGTADAGTLVFPENAGDVSIAGFCPPPLPTHVQAYASAHAGKDTNACSIYTEKPSNSSSAELTALKFRNGRLYLTNVIINTADVNSKADLAFAGINNVGKATFGVSVERAQLWMVQTVIAFFAESNVKAVDSSVYFINSLSYQVGPLSNWNEGGIDFLQFADLGSDHPLTLYAYYTVFHQDNLHVNAPVYVGPLVSNATTSVIRSTKQSALKSPPQIVFDMAFAHTHETIQPGCTGICICAPGVAQPILFLNTTSEDKKNYKALLPAVNSGCTANTSPPMVSPSTEMDFKSVMPPGHEEWVNSLIERGVPNAELLLDPTGKSSDSSSSLSSGAIAGIVVTIIILLIALAVLAFCLIRRRKNRAAAAHKAAAADKQAFYEQSGIGPLPPHGFSNHQDGYQPGQQESSLYLMGGMPAEVGAHSGIQEGAVYNVGTLPHLAHPGGYVSGHGKPGAPSNNTQMTYSSGGSRTLGVRTFEARSAYEASSTAEGGASQVGSQYGSQYESLTEKREQFGSHVQIDFSELDSCLNEVERLWGGVLLDRYVSLGSSKRSYGGQGAVQFATLKFNTEKKVAIKFFLSRTAFYTEQALYVNTSLHHILPPIDDVISNEDGRYTDPHGRAFPPFVVMEKGQPLDEFQRRSKPDFPSCMQIIHHLIKRIAELHACGFTHRDLKPSNTIWLSSRNEWTIIDFGSTATIGEKANLSISLGYAPPESMKARVERQNQVIADPAVDVWALGVVAIELLTGQTTYARDPCIPFEEQVIAKTIRGDKFFWEVEEDAPEIRKRLGFMTDALLRMVSRDPKDRPTLKEVDTQWRKILQQGTMMD